jgi:hypothetical protein
MGVFGISPVVRQSQKLRYAGDCMLLWRQDYHFSNYPLSKLTFSISENIC